MYVSCPFVIVMYKEKEKNAALMNPLSSSSISPVFFPPLLESFHPFHFQPM